jgi:hypothetical protein
MPDKQKPPVAVVLTFPPRLVSPPERELVIQWLSRAGDVPLTYVSERRSDDPALFARIIIGIGPGIGPTHLIHAPKTMNDLWCKTTISPLQVEIFDSLRAALNSIRDVLD